MALCDPCYDLFRIFEQDHIAREQQEDSRKWHVDNQFPSARAFRSWLNASDDKGSIPEALPQLPGLIHSSWESFCKSLDSFCPVCWVAWKHIRGSPTTSYREEIKQGFCLCFGDGVDFTAVLGSLELRYSFGMQDWYSIALWFKRATKQQFEEVVAQNPLEEHTGSRMTVETVKNWLSVCDAGHFSKGDGCVAKRHPVNNPTIPTRLIDVHSYKSETWSLIESKDCNSHPKYVALSHRWTADTPRLLQGNYHAFQADQPDVVLPRSYRDVFVLCRSLDIRYVWIDSLCIFQDSAEDFLHEAATMTEVYANAFCTFTICWESSCGFLRPRDSRAFARWDFKCLWDVDTRALSDRYVFVKDDTESHMTIAQAPVHRRGWVLQEQLLSPRVLDLGCDQFYWRCDKVQSYETAPTSLNVLENKYKRTNIYAPENRNHSIWQDLVAQFMSLDLTFERDRLLAISGIARFFLSPIEGILPRDSKPKSHRTHEKNLDQTIKYVAGLQVAHWIEDLLWSPSFRPEVPTHLGHRVNIDTAFNRLPDDIVPSWSWAACPGPIEWMGKNVEPCYQPSNARMPGAEGGPMAFLRNINFEPLGSDAYGLPKSASLDISCLLVEARYESMSDVELYFRSSKSPADQTKNKTVYTYTDGFLLPLPYPRIRSGKSPKILVPVEPFASFKPTCFIVPLLYPKNCNVKTVAGLVVQEVTRNDSKMREFVRIGSFGNKYVLGADKIIPALLDNLPVEGGEFEQRLRDSAPRWKDARKEDLETGRVIGNFEEVTVKAKWTTIRLV